MAGKRAQNQQEIIERRAQVAKFRLAGIRDQRRIADLLHVSLGTVNGDFKAVDKQWLESTVADTAVHKAQQDERLEAIVAANWEKVLEGNGWATDRVLAALAQKAKLLGLDAPVKQDIDLDMVTYQIIGLNPEEAA